MFSSLSSNELFTGAVRTVNVVKDPLSDNGFVAALCTRIEKGNDDLSKAMGKALNSEFTSQLFASDEARNQAFIGFRDYVRSFTHSNDGSVKTAAVSLAFIFEHVGNTIYRLGYVEKTAKMKTLLSNFSAPAAQNSIVTIGANQWMNLLETSQEAFEKVYKEKVDTESVIDNPIVYDAKQRITRYLKALLSYIDVSCDLDEGEKYVGIRDKIDDIITEIMTISRARGTRSENADKKPEKMAL